MRQRTGSPLPRQRDVAPAQSVVSASPLEDESGDPEAFYRWLKTWAWTLAGLIVYMTARWIVDVCIPTDPLASAELFRQVPLLVYQMSSTAFFTALVLNLTSLLFEDNATKRQLALLSCAIKGAACHTDLLLVTGHAHVVYDAFGAIVIPHRYVQWLVTTPTMVYILSKISDFTPLQTATAIGMDVAMIVSGLMANFLQWPRPYLNWLMFCVSTACFIGVLRMMGRMVYSAVKEHTSASSRRSLLFIYMCTLLIWSMFPLAWVLHVLNPTSPYGEYLNVFANFMAKVLFSSSIMYGNYMTIAQRRLLAQQAAENAHRVRMIQELRDAVTRKDQFMSLMSHELRTPLNGIIQLSDALVRGAGGEMNPKGQHFVKTIKNSSNHLLNIINDILDVAALKEGKLTIKHELCSLAKAVDHVVDIVAPLARKDVTIERHVDQRTPLIIADFSRVIQILYNLAGNALKFTHRGTVSVRVAPSADGSEVTLQVADTGIGIPADRINGIWGAFEQVDMSVTRKYGGTGLGLNIVQQLVEAHEGRIVVQSAEGRGTTFTVTLPVLQPNTRPSLEVQVAESTSKCGHVGARGAALLRRNNRLTSSSGRSPRSLEETMSQLARGMVRHASGLRSPKRDAADGNVSASNSMDREDVLYRRRTQELERENLMGELQRRTEHKRSMEESQLASRQLELSEPERQAERDSRSLECLDLKIAVQAATVRAFGGGKGGGGSGDIGRKIGGSAVAPAMASGGRGVEQRQRSETGLVAARCNVGGASSGNPGSYATWLGDAEMATRAVVGRRSLTAADAGEAVAAATARASGGGAVIGTFLPDSCDHLLIARASNDSHSSNQALVRKLSATSIGGGGGGGGKSSCTVRDALRMSIHGRGPGGGGGGGGTGSINQHGGPLPGTTSHLLSDLYRIVRDSHDDTSSVGADSESDGPRSGRRHGKAPIVRSGKLLPLSASLSSHNATAASSAAPPPGLTLDKLPYSDMYGTVQILSVDDEEVNQIVLEEILTSSDYHFARCMDGLEALEWLCSSDTMPDLILLDCMMPNMSGHEFCAMLRKVIPGNVLPVIMVSAKSDEDNIVEGLRSGSNDFVRKPYQREELLARIETQLRLKSDSWWLAELVNNVDGHETESMKLLKNILPESIIARMQQGQKFVADSHGHVVILFSDIVGFTSLSSKLPTAEVFLMLSNMFTAFDKLTDRFSVYKVETIGDAYMVAAGHDEDDDKARKGTPLMRVLGFARAMLDVVRNSTAPNGERMRIRIGVHCGPAFAGVIGMKCPRYCFLGDTVNTASRMESTGFPMCIHVSENVYRHHPNPEGELAEVGEREVKGKGRMRTYLVRVGAWEQALCDFAARQQAATAALQQQQQQLAMVHAAMRQEQQQQQQAGPGSTQCNHGDSAAAAALNNGGQLPPIRLSVLGGGAGSGGAGALSSGGSRSAGQLSLSLSPHGSDGNNTSRFVHLLSTVTEEMSLPSSPPPQAAAAAGAAPTEQQVIAAAAACSSLGGLMRLSSFSMTGARSPLSRPELSGGLRLPPRSTFGSEAYYHDESSEDGGASTLNGMVTASGMLRSCSGSLTGLMPAATSQRLLVGSAGAAGASSELNSGASGGGSAAAASSTEAVQRNDVVLGAAAAAAAAHENGELPGPVDSCSTAAGGGGGGGMVSIAADGKYAAQLFGGRVLSAGGSGLNAGPLPTAMDYLEQRVASLGRQLASESSKRQQLQADLDVERRRATTALQQVMLLQQQAVSVAAAAAAATADEGAPAAAAAGTGDGCHLIAAPVARAAAPAQHDHQRCPSHQQHQQRCLTGDAANQNTDGAERSAQQQPPPPGPPPQPQPRPGQRQRRQQRRSSHCSFSDTPDAEVVILGPADDDAAADGGRGAAATTVHHTPDPSIMPLPAPLPEPSVFHRHLKVEIPSMGDGVGQHAGNDPRAVARNGSGKSDSAVTIGGPTTRGGSTASEVPGLPFVLTDIEWHSNTLLGADDDTAAAASRPGGPRPPSGVGHLTAAERPAAATAGGGEAGLAAVPCRQGLKGRAPGQVMLHSPRNLSVNAKAMGVMAAAPAGLFGLGFKVAGVGGGGSSSAAAALQPGWLLPRYSLDLLFEELGLLPYLARFQEEAIRLDQLLGMDVEQLERLGLRPLGYCLRIREAVVELARGLLRACEEAALLANPPEAAAPALLDMDSAATTAAAATAAATAADTTGAGSSGGAARS